MQFPGWWVEGDQNSVRISRHMFDETELSEKSDWREAHQNEDPAAPHGFTEWSAALSDAERRLGIESQ